MPTLRLEAKPQELPELGKNLKRLRQARGWNLSRLAAEAGLPQSTMSKVEAGLMSLNFEKLWQVARVLEVDVQALFSTSPDHATDAGTMARRTLDRKSGKFGCVDHYRFQYLSTELKNRLMIPLLLEVGELAPITKRSAGQVPMMTLVGQRFAYVIEGPVEFHCEHYETVTLQKGDSLYVDAAMPHAFVSPKGVRAKVLTVLSSTNAEYLRLVREAAMRGDPDVSNRYKERRSAR